METTENTTQEITVDVRRRTYSSVGSLRELRSKSRVYVTHDFAGPEPTGPMCTDQLCGSPTCEAARRGGHPERCEVDHKVWRSWKRQALKATREAVLPKLAEALELPEGSLKLHFSDKAGCSCGCSPGFILEGAPHGLDIFVRRG